MDILKFTPLSITIGILIVLLTAFLRFYYPFRYQYMAALFRKHPVIVKRILERSFRKNPTAVGLLDKATKEILDGQFDSAEKYVLEGMSHVISVRGMRSRLIRIFFYNHLSWILFYKGQYIQSLEIAILLYEKFPTTPNILALITCNLARIGEIGAAIEALSRLNHLKKVNPTVLLSSQAEIEAAKGNLKKAVQLFNQAKERKSHATIYFIVQEIEKRIGQLQKPA